MSNEIQTRLIGFIQQDLMPGDARQVNDASPLLDWGVIESLKMVALLTFIETEFGVRVPEQEQVPNNFETVRTLASMVTRLREAGQ
jgi:acyl carrier protein